MKTTPKDFFLNLAVTVLAYASAISLLTVLFEIINNAFPDPLEYVDPYNGAMRFAISTLVIAYPLTLAIIWNINKDIARTPEKRELPIRRWLSYLTLFVAGAAIAVDLIVLLNSFLGGEVTSRFVLKVLAVLVVAGLMFGYYFYSLRRKITEKSTFNKSFAVIVALVSLGTIVGSFAVIGSPTKTRLVRFDERKVDDLNGIRYQVINYWQAKKALPTTLAEVDRSGVGGGIPVDPQSGAVYEYSATGPLKFKLCGDFNLSSSEGPRSNAPYGVNEIREHEAGHQCFDLTIDPDVYAPRKNTDMDY